MTRRARVERLSETYVVEGAGIERMEEGVRVPWWTFIVLPENGGQRAFEAGAREAQGRGSIARSILCCPLHQPTELHR